MAINQNNQFIGNRQGSGFTNLQRILQANQQNRLGQAVGQGVNKQVAGVRSNLQAGQSLFQTDAEKAKLGTDQDKQMVNENVNKALTQTDPNAVNTNFTPDITNKFSTFLKGQYTGPQEINNISNINAQAKQGEQLASNIGSPEGKQNILRSFVKAPNYSRGQQNLDTLLVDRGQQGSQNLNQARRQAFGLSRDVNLANDAAKAEAAQNTAQNKQFGNEVRQQLGLNDQGQFNRDTGVAADIVNSATNRGQQALTKQEQDFQNYTAQLKNSDVSQQEAALTALGMSPEDAKQYIGTQRYNTDILPYLTKENLATDVSSAASPEELAKLNALSKLGGIQQDILDPNRTGALAKQTPVQFAGDRAKQAIGERQSAYNTNLENLNSQIANLDEQINAGQRGSLGGGVSAAEVNRVNALLQQKLQLQKNANDLKTQFGQQDFIDTNALQNLIAQRTAPTTPANSGRGRL